MYLIYPGPDLPHSASPWSLVKLNCTTVRSPPTHPSYSYMKLVLSLGPSTGILICYSVLHGDKYGWDRKMEYVALSWVRLTCSHALASGSNVPPGQKWNQPIPPLPTARQPRVRSFTWLSQHIRLTGNGLHLYNSSMTIFASKLSNLAAINILFLTSLIYSLL